MLVFIYPLTSILAEKLSLKSGFFFLNKSITKKVLKSRFSFSNVTWDRDFLGCKKPCGKISYLWSVVILMCLRLVAQTCLRVVTMLESPVMTI